MMILQRDRGNERELEVFGLEEVPPYVHGMLSYCRIRGLPDRTVSELDNEKHIYYRITGLLPVRDVWQKERPDRALLEQLLSALKDCVEQLPGYLLQPSQLLLHAAYVFTNAKGEFFFIYVPGLEGSFGEHVRELCQEILRLFDPADRSGLREIYRLCAPLLQEPEKFPDALFRTEKSLPPPEVREEALPHGKEKKKKWILRKKKMPPEEQLSQPVNSPSVWNGEAGTGILAAGEVTKLVPERKDLLGEISIAEGTGTLGRQPDCCRYVLSLPGVSREHARLRRERGQVWITDMGSTNGTYVNSSRLVTGRAVRLRSGDILGIANLLFTCA